MATPWTQSLELLWRPALTFYEKRTAILRCLDDREVLRAFRVRPDHVDARLIKPGHELQVRQNGLTLELLGQDADLDLGWECVVKTLDLIKPQNTTMRARYQHLIPLDSPFDDAVRAARDCFLNVPPVQDFALLVTFDEGANVEFGIIGKDEALPRFTRRVGRMQPSGERSADFEFWRHIDFPEVAFFADSRWPGPEIEGELEGAVEQIRDWWAGAREGAAKLVESLYGKISVEA